MDAVTRWGDFTGDRHEDVIARQTSTGTLWLYPGNPGGTGFAARLRVGATGWNGMREISAVGDFDGDGRADLVAVERATGILYLYPGRATTLGPRRLLGRSGWNGMSELAGVGDFNGDGCVDLVGRQDSTGELWLYPGTDTRLGPRCQPSLWAPTASG